MFTPFKGTFKESFFFFVKYILKDMRISITR
jgi:hypothetical protein